MKKIIKKIAVFLIVLILLLVLFVVAWVFLIFPSFVAPKDEVAEVEPGSVQIAEDSEKIDFNEANGVLYVNNEVIVFVRASASEDKIAALFDSFDAEIDESMADIDVYRLVFKEAMTYDDLESLIKKIKSDPIVENAYLNTVTEFEADTTDTEDDFEYKNPAFPDDPWNSDTWNVTVPRGENWGVEAIDAPGAWGYLDQMSSVRIGLIDSMPNLSHEDLSFANSSCLFIDEGTGITNTNKYSISADDHGTHVSGTMNAAWDNTAGVSGVMGGKGELYYSAVYYDANGKLSSKYATAYSYLLALKTLIDQDVQVINISQNTSRLIGFAASHGNQNAINHLSLQADLTEKGLNRIISAREAADKPDFVVCVAAGNSNSTYYYKDDNATYGYREEMTTWETVKYLFGWRGERGNSLALYNNFLNLMDAESVKDRVIVVGAVGIDSGASTQNNTQYSYAYFSNVGSRVDVVAPGVDVYSCTANGYGSLSGTSMATPHVSGVAGLIFACNPALSGPEVKDILVASTTGRYYHGGEYSGLLNANNSVVNALKTVETSVEKVLKTEVDNGLDLCFVVDTTGSMGDDIENAKANMASILEHLAAKTENYRVALIDYRDYPERSNESEDYPYKIQLYFTSNNESITDAINGLDLGNGGDSEETVYSALMSAVKLDWRSDAKKVIIILGDAAPLDPEPITDFTYDDVLLALFNADINIDYEDSDDRVVDALDASLINVFSIGTDASSDAADFFEQISTSTGGSYASVDDASKVGDAIIDSIEQIEVAEKITVNADFGDAMANQKINLYSGKEYLFTMETDKNGQFVIDSIEADTYRWTSNSLYSGGSIDIDTNSRDATIRMTKDYWFTPLLQLWHQYSYLICIALLAYIAVCIAVPVSIKKIRVRVQKKKASVTTVTIPAPIAEQPQEPESAPVLEDHVSDEDNLLCPNCGFKVASAARFCKQCGFDLQIAQTKAMERVCKNCGHLCKENEVYCGKCGTKLEKE
jgi:subtilisin family serine protease